MGRDVWETRLVPKQVDAPSAQYVEHRDRLLDAMAEAVRADGLRGSTVADVVRIARVSRRTFYQHFDDLDDCYLTLMRRVSDDALRQVREAVLDGGTAERRITRGFERWLAHLDHDPALYRSLWLESHLTGERGRHADATLNRRWIELYQQLGTALRAEAGLDPLPHEVAVMISGSIRELVLDVLERGRSPREAAPNQIWLTMLVVTAEAPAVEAVAAPLAQRRR